MKDIINFSNGEIHQGEVVDGKPHGKVVYKWPNNQIKFERKIAELVNMIKIKC